MRSKDLSRRQIYPMIIWLFAVLCGIAALIFFILIVHEWSFMTSSITTQGTIIDEGTEVSKSSTSPYVVVQFTDTQGTTQTETIYEGDGGFSSHFHDPVGQTITIRYLADDPHTVEIEGTSAGKVQMYQLVSIVFGLFSLTFCIWGIIRLLRKSQPKRLTEPLLKG